MQNSLKKEAMPFSLDNTYDEDSIASISDLPSVFHPSVHNMNSPGHAIQPLETGMFGNEGRQPKIKK